MKCRYLRKMIPMIIILIFVVSVAAKADDFTGQNYTEAARPEWAELKKELTCLIMDGHAGNSGWVNRDNMWYFYNDGSVESIIDVSANEDAAWEFLYEKIGNAYGTAGLMGNLFVESMFMPDNLEDFYESYLGFTNEEYTELTDDGSYSGFSSDCAGYGLAQWTYVDRKEALLNTAAAENCSIGDINMQLDFLWRELEGWFGSLLYSLRTATSIEEASSAVMLEYEKPLETGTAARTERAAFGQVYYEKYAAE